MLAGPGLPRRQEPPLYHSGRIQRDELPSQFGSQVAAGVCRKAGVLPLSIRLRGSTPDFLLGLTPLALSPPGVRTRQCGYLPIARGLVCGQQGVSARRRAMHASHLGAKPPPRSLQFSLEPRSSSIHLHHEEVLRRTCCGEAIYWRERLTNCILFTANIVL